MSTPPVGSIDVLSLPAAVTSASQAGPSGIEREVIDLFDRFRDPAFRYVLSFGISVHDAEEVTQEVFLALFRHLQLGRCRRNLRGWIFRVAHNLALKRRTAIQRARDTIEPDWAVAARRCETSPNPEDQLAVSQKQQRLLAVFQVLPEEDRRCLRLRAEGLRYREIADALNMSLGAVSISLTRSLARLTRAGGM
jgi:RNA polymerase sigma-70 factor (ECF subfamily)